MNFDLIIEIQNVLTKIQGYLNINAKESFPISNIGDKKAIIGIKFNKINLTKENRIKVLQFLDKLKNNNNLKINDIVIDEEVIKIICEEKYK